MRCESSDHYVLLQIAEKEGWEATERFKAVVDTIGGRNADLQSSLVVAAGFMYELWKKKLPMRQRENLTYALINALTQYHGKVTSALLEALILVGDKFGRLEQRLYRSALLGWCEGHFIPYPGNRSSSLPNT